MAYIDANYVRANRVLPSSLSSGGSFFSETAARMGQINALLQAGAAEQGMTQSNLDLAYRQFLEEQNYPLAQLALGQSILGQTPMGSTTRAPIRTG